MTPSLGRCLILILLAAASLQAVPLPKEKESWVAVRVNGFEIYSNAGEKAALAAASDLSAMTHAVSRLTNLQVRSPLTTKVFLFRSEGSFRPYREAILGRENRTAEGIFLRHRDGNFMVVNEDSGSRGVVYHELMHYFLANTLEVPLWFNEGFAELYSTFEVKGDEAMIGRPVPHHVLWLRGQQLIPLRELFEINQDSKDYNEGLRQGVFYAQSWAFVHYVLVGNEHRKGQMNTFLVLLSRGEPTESAFRKTFGVGFEEMEQELRAYIRRAAFAYARHGDLGSADERPAVVTELPRDEVLYQLGDLLAHGDGSARPDAREFLTEAVRLNPSHAGAHADLGLLLQMDGKPAEAAAAYRRAASLGGSLPMPYLLAAEDLMRQAYERGEAGAAAALEARALFRKATGLVPAMPRAWSGLGSTYLFGADGLEEGIAAFERSWELSPTQADVAYGLVVLHARKGDRAAAADWFQRHLVRLGNEEIVREGREQLLVADAEEAYRLAREGKLTEAMALLEKVAAASTVKAFRDHLREQAAEMAAFEAREAGVSLYEEAVRKANAQDFAGALAAAEKVIATATDPDLVAAAKELADELRAFLKK